MFDKIKDIITIISYCAFSIILVVCAFSCGTSIYTLMLIFILFLTGFTVRTYFLSADGMNPAWRIISTCTDLVVASFICKIDVSGAGLCLYAFLIGDIVLNSGKKSGFFLTAADYGCFCFSLFGFFKGKSDLFSIAVLISIPIFALFIIIFALIRSQITQNEKLRDTLKKLMASRLETESLYKQLKEAYEKAEDSAVQGERNRIAREIHDTVGHTLTTVLIEQEAAKKLLGTNTNLAGEKLQLAQGQVRKGLNDIRRSVHMLGASHDIMDFFDSVDALLGDCVKNWGVAVKSEIDRSLFIPEDEAKVIYACLEEGLTNGKRHGKSTAFVVKLIKRDDKISLSLEDNGAGSAAVCPGFGLRAMRERVESLGGSLKIETAKDEGFSLYVTLPLKSKG